MARLSYLPYMYLWNSGRQAASPVPIAPPEAARRTFLLLFTPARLPDLAILANRNLHHPSFASPPPLQLRPIISSVISRPNSIPFLRFPRNSNSYSTCTSSVRRTIRSTNFAIFPTTTTLSVNKFKHTMASGHDSSGDPVADHSLPNGDSPRIRMPPMIYGTAWKKEKTADHVYNAIRAGFRGIDTAGMKRHYDEALAGEGIRRAISEGIVKRSDLYIQTKYTPNDSAFQVSHAKFHPITQQVYNSVASSLENLKTSDVEEDQYIDCLVMHSPFPNPEQTLEAWSALESFVPHKIRSLGISNVTLQELQNLTNHKSVQVQPSVIQNRFRAQERQWDLGVRKWCKNRGGTTKYQGFWTLTGNRHEYHSQGFVKELAEAAGISKETAWYSLILAMNIVILNGTTSEKHMREDLDAIGKVARWRGTDEGREVWERCFQGFKDLVGEV